MLSNSFVVIMIIIILILALAIMLLANVLLGAAQIPPPEPPSPEDTAPTYANGLARTAGADASYPTQTDAPQPINAAAPLPIIAMILLAASLIISAPFRAEGPADSQATTAAASIASYVTGVSDTAFYMITGV